MELATLLILTVLCGVPNDGAKLGAVDIYRCEFETPDDKNFDGWPDGWIRRIGPSHPEYVQIGITQRADAPSPKHCLLISLDGGAGAISSPPIAVNPRFSLQLTAKMRLSGLKNDAGQVLLSFYSGDTLVETAASPLTTKTDGWMPINIGPVTPRDPRVDHAVISVTLGPRGPREDLTGKLYLDDLRLTQLPRMALRTSSETGVFTALDSVQVTAEVSGSVNDQSEVTFELLNAGGEVIATQRFPWGAAAEAQANAGASPTKNRDRSPDSSPAEMEGFVGARSWKPTVPDFGFYKVRVSLQHASGHTMQQETSLVVVRPAASPKQGEFGWSLPEGERTMPLRTMALLLSQAGVNWAKYPVWYRSEQANDRIAWFAERLSISHVELVGVLDHPRDEMGAAATSDSRQQAAAIFSEPDIWKPAIDPVMTRLSLKVRWWQLGDDQDQSFMGYVDREAKVAEIKKHFERFGQEVKLGFGWKWLQPIPTQATNPWEFLSITSEPALTSDEIGVYLGDLRANDAKLASAAQNAAPRGQRVRGQAASSAVQRPAAAGAAATQLIQLPRLSNLAATRPAKAPLRRWLVLEPLAKSKGYSLATRTLDLVARMLAAKIHGADAVFVPQPFSDDHGLMNSDGTPGELFLPWRTTALAISGAQYVGQIQLPGGSTNHVFARDGQAVMVVWNDTPTKERFYLGGEIRRLDVWGRETSPPRVDGQLEQEIEVGPLPIFITGLNAAVARFQIAVSFEKLQISSVLGREQSLSVKLRNFFEQGVGGTMELHAPKTWEGSPRVNFKVTEKEETVQAVPVTLLQDANSGLHPVRLDFVVTADRQYSFSVYRTLQLGLDDVAVQLATRLRDKDGVLEVEQQLTNTTDGSVSFQCVLFPPGRRRETRQVINLGRGKNTVVFELPNGAELLGQRIYLRAEEIGGNRVLNHSVVSER